MIWGTPTPYRKQVRAVPPRSGNGSRRLGDILVEKNYLSGDQLERALSFQRESGAKLGEALIKLGYIIAR